MEILKLFIEDAFLVLVQRLLYNFIALLEEHVCLLLDLFLEIFRSTRVLRRLYDVHLELPVRSGIADPDHARASYFIFSYFNLLRRETVHPNY